MVLAEVNCHASEEAHDRSLSEPLDEAYIARGEHYGLKDEQRHLGT